MVLKSINNLEYLQYSMLNIISIFKILTSFFPNCWGGGWSGPPTGWWWCLAPPTLLWWWPRLCVGEWERPSTHFDIFAAVDKKILSSQLYCQIIILKIRYFGPHLTFFDKLLLHHPTVFRYYIEKVPIFVGGCFWGFFSQKMLYCIVTFYKLYIHVINFATFSVI